MGWRFGLIICGVPLLLSVARRASAEAPPSVVWYRASAECPSEAEFLQKLAGGARRARLAQAGDHIDFVVTLLAAPGETVGRLERQTQGGTVAIRELRDVSCARVADGLALSLGLALEPGAPRASSAADGASEPTSPPADSDASAAPAPAPASAAPVTKEEPAPPLSVPRTDPLPVSAARPPADASHPRAARHPRWSVGLDGGAIFGVAPSALARGTVFVQADHALPEVASDLAFRLAVVGALGSPRTEIGPVKRWLAAGRAEACPWRWGGEALNVRPCLAFELGATGASAAEHASSIWAAPGLTARAALTVLPGVGLELEAGALAPLSRSEVAAGSVVIYRSEIISLAGSFGISFGPF
jgi:hypothetical protein